MVHVTKNVHRKSTNIVISLSSCLLMFGSSDVSCIGISSSASDITEFTPQLILTATPTRGRGSASLHCCFLLFVFLSFKVFSVCLKTQVNKSRIRCKKINIDIKSVKIRWKFKTPDLNDVTIKQLKLYRICYQAFSLFPSIKFHISLQGRSDINNLVYLDKNKPNTPTL